MSRKKPTVSYDSAWEISTSNSGGYPVDTLQQQSQTQPMYFDQDTGQWMDPYGRVVGSQQTSDAYEVQSQQAPNGFEVQPQPNYYTDDVYQSPEEPEKRHGVGFWIGIILGLLASIAALAVLVFFLLFNNQASSRAGDLGQLEGKSDAEIIAELNRVVEEGMFNISISSMVVFPDGESEGELKIENVPGNRYLMQVDIVRNDNGEVIYESGILDPNHHIQKDRLSVDLDAGVYECTAVFHALDPETEKQTGSASAGVEVVVQG